MDQGQPLKTPKKKGEGTTQSGTEKFYLSRYVKRSKIGEVAVLEAKRVLILAQLMTLEKKDAMEEHGGGILKKEDAGSRVCPDRDLGYLNQMGKTGERKKGRRQGGKSRRVSGAGA